MVFIDELVAKLRQVSDVGTERLSDGVWLIGKLPPRKDGLFSEAYLHEIYRGLTQAELDQLAEQIRQEIPEELGDFYRQANGLSLFSDSIAIKGLRTDYSRAPSVRQPISLEYGNTIELPVDPKRARKNKGGAPRKQIRFGHYTAVEAELVYYLEGEPAIEAVPIMRFGPALFSWPDFETMLMSEVDRMTTLYKDTGGTVDPLNPFGPPWPTD